jgi:GNAT superfamily N-acetyltransferase
MNVIDIRTYEGDGRDIAELEQRVWRKAFHGKAWYPVWDQPYFAWRVLEERLGSRNLCLGAYDGTKLVACVLAEAVDLQVGDQRVPGSYSSWLAVDPETRSRGLAMRLMEELHRRHRERALMISLGCTRSDPKSPPNKFWASLAQRAPQEFSFWGPIRFWTCVLNPSRVAAAGFSTFERYGPLALKVIPWPWIGSRRPADVRPYQCADLADCLRLVDLQGRQADLRMIWNGPRLDWQLAGAGFPRTLVSVVQDRVQGFVNYYPVRWCGAAELRVAVIDLFAGEGSWLAHRRLLSAAQTQMRDEGIDLAVMMASQASPGGVLCSRGFVPIDAHAISFGLMIDPRLRVHRPRRLHILFT